MLVSEIATRVKRQFGDEANVQIGDSDIIRWVNDAQKEIAAASDLLQTSATSPIVINQQTYEVPPDILLLRNVQVNGTKLNSLSSQEADEYFSQPDTIIGIPSHFWKYANEINLFPIPNVAGTLKIYYTRRPAEIAVITDVPEVSTVYHPRIVEYCLAQAYELDENWSASQLKSQQFTEGVKALKDEQDWAIQDVYPHITSSYDDC